MMLPNPDERARLEAERDQLVARLERGHREYFAGFTGERSTRLAREDPAGYRKAENLWIELLRQYEAICDQLEDGAAPPLFGL